MEVLVQLLQRHDDPRGDPEQPPLPGVLHPAIEKAEKPAAPAAVAAAAANPQGAEEAAEEAEGELEMPPEEKADVPAQAQGED